MQAVEAVEWLLAEEAQAVGVAVAAGLVLKALQPLVLVWQTRVQVAEAAGLMMQISTVTRVPGGLGLWFWHLVRLRRKPVMLGSSLSRGRRRHAKTALRGCTLLTVVKLCAPNALPPPTQQQEARCALVRPGRTTTRRLARVCNVI